MVLSALYYLLYLLLPFKVSEGSIESVEEYDTTRRRAVSAGTFMHSRHHYGESSYHWPAEPNATAAVLWGAMKSDPIDAAT